MGDEILAVLETSSTIGVDDIVKRLAAAYDITATLQEVAEHLALMKGIGLVEDVHLGWGVSGWKKTVPALTEAAL